jgi:hypothetical protein
LAFKKLFMKQILILFGMISFIACTGQTDIAGKSDTPNELVADNGTLTVKFDLTRGGAISWISLSGSQRSLVNIADEGRYIQQVITPVKASTAKLTVSRQTGRRGRGIRFRWEMHSATGLKFWITNKPAIHCM